MKQKLITEIPRQFFSGKGTPQNILQVLLNNVAKDNSKKDLNYIIYAIGEKTIDYLIHMQRSLGQVNENPKLHAYIKNIKYTNIGLIDRPSTSRETFNEILNQDANDTYIIDRKFIFVEACRYCLSESSKMLWELLEREEKNDIDASLADTSNNSDIPGLDKFMKTIVKYWRGRMNSPTNDNDDYTKNKNVKLEIENIFKNYTLRVLDEGIEMLKYFLNELKLESEDKDHFILDHLLKYDLTLYFSNSVDHWIYLMKELTDGAREVYLHKNKDSLLNLMFDSWPWRYLYLGIVDSNKNPALMSKKNSAKMLGEIFGKIVDELEIKKNTEYLSFWMIDEFLNKYNTLFNKTDIIQLYWSTTSADFISKVKLLVPLMKHFKLKKIQPRLTEDQIIKELTSLSFMFDLYDEFDLLHNIAEEILLKEKDKVAIMKEINLDNMCLYFLMNSINDDRKIDNVIEWTFDWDEKKIDRYKESMKLTKVVKRIITSEKGKHSINDILKSLFEWKGYSRSKKINLEKCLKNYSDDKKVQKWDKFKKCLIKSIKS